MRTLEWKALNALHRSTVKATKLLECGVEPPEEQTELESVVLGFLSKDMDEPTSDSFDTDVLCLCMPPDDLYKKYFE